MNWSVILMCFAASFAITTGIALPILFGAWLEKRLGLKD